MDVTKEELKKLGVCAVCESLWEIGGLTITDKTCEECIKDAKNIPDKDPDEVVG